MTEFSRLQLLLEPCQSIQELDNYVKVFFGLDLPFDIVDERSTSAPLLFLWGVYNTFLTGKGPGRHVLAASRNTTKTLSSALIEYFSLVHFRRDSVHLAAILDQSTTAIRYIDNFLSIPELVPYRSIDNARTKRIMNLPPNDFTSKSDAILRVITATKKSANSPRASTLVLDEVDLTPSEILSETAYIGDPTRCGHKFNPVWIYLSSRKSNDGPIQKLMDEAEGPKGSRIKLHKWSAADFMERCPPEVHQPDKPVKAFLHTESLKVVWGEEAFQSSGASSTAEYKEISAFEGCRTCSAFVACQARSPKQRSDSAMLRDRQFVGDLLDAVGDPAVIIAQSLNWKPETTGLVFKLFSQNQHVKRPVEFYKWVTGHYFNPDDLPEEDIEALLYDHEGKGAKNLDAMIKLIPTKLDIYAGMVKAGWKIHYGVDYGYSPDPAVVVIVGYHQKTKRACVLHVDASNPRVKPMDNYHWSEYVSTTIWPVMPGDLVAPDLADKASPSYFGKHNIPCLGKKPHLVDTGVSQLRGLLWNPITAQANFAILLTGDLDKNEMAINEFAHWTHARTPTGWNFNKYDEDNNNHCLDAIRYALSPFVKDLKVTLNAQQLTADTVDTAAEYIAQSEAQRKALMEQDGKDQLAKYFLQEHGMGDIFNTQKTFAALKATEEANAKMRMNQRERLEAEHKANSTPPEPQPGKKTRLKYAF